MVSVRTITNTGGRGGVGIKARSSWIMAILRYKAKEVGPHSFDCLNQIARMK